MKQQDTLALIHMIGSENGNEFIWRKVRKVSYMNGADEKASVVHQRT